MTLLLRKVWSALGGPHEKGGSHISGAERVGKAAAIMKQLDDPAGGRAFFVHPGTTIDDLILYLKEQPVLVELRGAQPCHP